MDPSNFLGATMIDIDIDTGLSGDSDLPTWLRDLLDRALNGPGIRNKKKVASEEAIASLQDVDLSTQESLDCPICYDAYDSRVRESSSQLGGNSTTKERKQSKAEEVNFTIGTNREIIEELRTKCNINLESMSESGSFNDPSLFLPVDQAGVSYCRFPQRNLYNLQSPSREDILPGYENMTKAENKKQTQKEIVESAGHSPVKMPNCDHVFGKLCIIEWLINNVSCPLCRKEVEELKEADPNDKKIERLKAAITSNYNDFDGTLSHLLSTSTDIFNPFRRPFNAAITPLTDSYVNQNLATPTVSLPGNSVESVSSREPNLVLPGKFPIPDFPIAAASTFTFPRPRVNTTNNDRTNRSFNLRQQPEDDTDSSLSDEWNERTNTRSPSVDSNMSANSAGRVGRENRAGPRRWFQFISRRDTDGVDNRSDSSRSERSETGRGGPERSRRSPNSGGRTHPYHRD